MTDKEIFEIEQMLINTETELADKQQSASTLFEVGDTDGMTDDEKEYLEGMSEELGRY